MKCTVALITNFIISGIRSKFVTWYDLVSVIGCLSGILMITQPTFLFHDNNIYMNRSYSSCHVSGSLASPRNFTAKWTSYPGETDPTSDRHKEEIIGYILCVTAGVVIATYQQVVNRKLADVNSFIYTFWASLFGIVSSFCIMAATETPYIPSLPLCITWFLLHSIMSGSFTIATYKFFQLVDPVTASLIQTLQIPASFILQFTLFSDLFPGRADAVGIYGSVLVVVGNAFVPLYKVTVKWRAKRSTNTETDTEYNTTCCAVLRKQNILDRLCKLIRHFCSHCDRNRDRNREYSEQN